MKNLELKAIALNKLIAHPDNPNVMSGERYRKLVRNIERTGLYEPIVVRAHPQKRGLFQIINGHHRVKALERIGRKEADCIVWDVDDEQTAVLLATLNRLCGTDEPGKKIELLRKLTSRMPAIELAKILPATSKQIEQLTSLKLTAERCPLNAGPFAIPLVFFVTAEQNRIVEEALSKIPAQPGLAKSQRRSAAITEIASQFLRADK
jgi:hypothetical protein